MSDKSNLLHLSAQKLHAIHFMDGSLSLSIFVKFDESIQQAVTMTSSLHFKTRDGSTVLEGFGKVKLGAKEGEIANKDATICILKHGWLHGIERREMSHSLCNFYWD